MAPTLDLGEHVLIGRFAYRIRTPAAFPLTSFPFPSASVEGWSDVERGDIVAFLSPRERALGEPPVRATTYAKRCVAIPGDTVRLNGRVLRVQGGHRGSTVYRSDSLQVVRAEDRRWIVPARGDTLRHGSVSKNQLRRIVRRDGHRVSFSKNGLRVDGQQRRYYVVEQAYYFVLGDNLDMSRDSRHWGLVPEANLVGPVLGIVWPLRIGDSLS